MSPTSTFAAFPDFPSNWNEPQHMKDGSGLRLGVLSSSVGAGLTDGVRKEGKRVGRGFRKGRIVAVAAPGKSGWRAFAIYRCCFHL